MSRGVKPSVEEGVEKNNVDRCSCRGGVEEKAKTQEENLDRSTKYQEGIEIVIRKSMEARQIAKCQRGVELAFKISFLRREKHRHECN